MARRRRTEPGGDWLFPQVATDSRIDDTSLLDVVDNVLNHGVVLHGELVLGVANVDLIYAKLSVLLGALDKVGSFAAPPPGRSVRRARHRDHATRLPRKT